MHHIFHISYAQKFKGYGNLTCVGDGGSLKLKTVLHFEREQISWNRKGNSTKSFALKHFPSFLQRIHFYFGFQTRVLNINSNLFNHTLKLIPTALVAACSLSLKNKCLHKQINDLPKAVERTDALWGRTSFIWPSRKSAYLCILEKGCELQ